MGVYLQWGKGIMRNEFIFKSHCRLQTNFVLNKHKWIINC